MKKLEKFFALFYDQTRQKYKWINYLRWILVSLLLINWGLAYKKGIESFNYDTYESISQFIVALVMLLTGVESYLNHKNKKKDYMFWFGLSILYFFITLDRIYHF